MALNLSSKSLKSKRATLSLSSGSKLSKVYFYPSLIYIMTTHLVGFCHLSRERHQNDRTSLSVFLVRYDGEEKQTWGNRFQSISKTSPDWKNIGHRLCFFLMQGSSKVKTPGTFYLSVYFTALILHLPILMSLKTCSPTMLCSWSVPQTLEFYIEHPLSIGKSC